MRKKIRLYAFDGCPFCKELKDKFDNDGLDYDYIDINKEEYKEEFQKIMDIGKTDSVPVVLVNKVILSPEISFTSIDEAFKLTKKFLNKEN